MKIDLDIPLFTASKTVDLVNRLTLDTLKNWEKRGIAPTSGRRVSHKQNILRTIRDLIILQIMVDLAAFDFKPSFTLPLAKQIADTADEFFQSSHFQKNWGRSERDGIPQYLFTTDAANTYRRAVITNEGDGQYKLRMLETAQADTGLSNNLFRAHLLQFAGGSAYVVVEADVTAALVLNRALVAGVKPSAMYIIADTLAQIIRPGGSEQDAE